MKKKCKYNSLLFPFGKMCGLISALLLLLFFSCEEVNEKKQSTESGEKQIYYCPMHPEVQQDHPGTCPKCNGMPLVLKNTSLSLDDVLRPVSSNVLSKINIVNPVRRSLPVITQVQGFIDYDNYLKWD